MTSAFKPVGLSLLIPLFALLLVVSCGKEDDPQPSGDAIVAEANQSFTVSAVPSDGLSIGTVQASSEQNLDLTFTLTSIEPSGTVAIDAATGELTVADANTLFDTDGTVTGTVDISAGMEALSVDITITFSDLGQPIISEVEQDFTIEENPEDGATIGTVVASSEQSRTLTFAIQDQSRSGAVTIDPATGELTVADGTQFSFEDGEPLTLEVLISTGETELVVTITINLTNQAEAFITTWGMTAGNLDLTINASGFDYNYDIDWGDGTVETGLTSVVTHTYAEPGEYQVAISGEYPWFDASNADQALLLSIDAWGDQAWLSMQNSFRDCANMEYNATDRPDLTAVTNMSGIFLRCDNFNGAIGDWDVSNVTQMRFAIADLELFNQPLNDWDVSNVTDFYQCFREANSFNQPLDQWDVGSAEDMREMFRRCPEFNQDIGDWNVSNVTTMAFMFQDADAFDQNLNEWDVRKVTIFDNMFSETELYNQPMDQWETIAAESMAGMFQGTGAFNQALNSWSTGTVTSMAFMFNSAQSFNQPLDMWDVSQVESFSSMFRNTAAFNQDIGGWTTESVTNMLRMFQGAQAFNQDLSGWDTDQVSSFGRVFEGCSSFTFPLGAWDISSATDVSSILAFTGLSSDSYEATLLGWSSTAPDNLTLQSNGLEYCDTAGRDALIAKGWTITGDTQVCP